MSVAENGLEKRQNPVARTDSFSTVTSSTGAAELVKYYANKTLSETPTPKALITSTNLKFEDSENIHVGNREYHIHHHAAKNEPKSSRSNSVASSTSKISTQPSFSEKKNKRMKKLCIFGILISILAITAAVSVTIYFWFFDGTAENGFPSYLVTRDKWGADEPKSTSIPELEMPIKRIIIGHTGGHFCETESECINAVKTLQFQDDSVDDIPYNFLIGDDGKMYEGRGFKYEGQHTKNTHGIEYNSIGIGIAFIGNYTSEKPNDNQITLLKSFINYFIKNETIAPDYIIVSQNDLKYSSNQATGLNSIIATLDNYRTFYKIHRREEWKALNAKRQLVKFNRGYDWVLMHHSATPECTDLDSCIETVQSLQKDSFDQNMIDIEYNIIFGGNGIALEGREWDTTVAIEIGVIGDFTTEPPNDGIINAIQQFFEDAKALGKLDKNYEIYGKSNFGRIDCGPGDAFMNVIKHWCRFWIKTDDCSHN